MKKTVNIYKAHLFQVPSRQLYREWQDGSANLNRTIRSWKKVYEAMEDMDINQLPDSDQKMWQRIAKDLRESTLALAKIFDKGNSNIAALDGSFDDDLLK